MKNSQMIAGRFLKRQEGKRKYVAIINHLKLGGTVLVCTMTKIIKLSAKHADLVKLGKSGSVYLNKSCIDYCGVRLV